MTRTVINASLHPGRFFTAVSQRKDRRISGAGSFVVACFLAAVCLHVAAFVLRYFVIFLESAFRFGDPLRALDLVAATIGTVAPTAWFMPSLLTLPLLLSVFPIAFLLTRLFRSHSGALRTTDFAALLSPAITLGAFIAAVTDVLQTPLQHASTVLSTLKAYGGDAALLLLVWHLCRKLLALSRVRTGAMVVVCWVLLHGVYVAVDSVLTSLLWSMIFP